MTYERTTDELRTKNKVTVRGQKAELDSKLASSTGSSEDRIIASLSAVVADLDVDELRIFLRRFDGVDVELEAHRFASTVSPETRPLRAFENWLAKARPSASVRRSAPGSSRALPATEIDARLERIRRNLEGCEVFGERFLSPEEVEQNLAYYREKLEARR